MPSVGHVDRLPLDMMKNSRLQRLLRADEAMLKQIRCLQWPWLTVAMRGLTRLGDVSSWVVLGLVLLACGGAAQHYGALLAVGALIATGLSQVVKRTCRRTRPSLGIRGFVALVENPDVFSFPSGHTSVAVGVAIALAGQGAALGPLMAALAAGVAVSRLYLGAHYPLDVAAGVLLGGCSGILARALERWCVLGWG